MWVGRGTKRHLTKGLRREAWIPLNFVLASPGKGLPGSNSCSTLWGPIQLWEPDRPYSLVTPSERRRLCGHTLSPPTRGSQEQLPGVAMGPLHWDSPTAVTK